MTEPDQNRHSSHANKEPSGGSGILPFKNGGIVMSRILVSLGLCLLFACPKPALAQSSFGVQLLSASSQPATNLQPGGIFGRAQNNTGKMLSYVRICFEIAGDQPDVGSGQEHEVSEGTIFSLNYYNIRPNQIWHYSVQTAMPFNKFFVGFINFPGS